MSDTPTPETDAAYWDIRHDDGTTEEVVNADFARNLELQRDAARAELARYRDSQKSLVAKSLCDDGDLLNERDEWEERASRLAEIVGRLTDTDIGEHSNANDPVVNAIEAGEVAVSEIAELRRDKARLDHLTGLTNTTWVLNGRIWQSSDLRDAIDAAMQEGGDR